MDVYTVSTYLGNIQITKNAIAKLVMDAVKEFDGKVLLSNHRGRIMPFVQKLGSMDGYPHMDIAFKEEGLDVKIYVVIRFGTSITRVTNRLIEDIHKSILQVTGVAPDSIAVVVAGTISKNLKRRNIEVKRQYDSE